jgi:hypothetical protein
MTSGSDTPVIEEYQAPFRFTGNTCVACRSARRWPRRTGVHRDHLRLLRFSRVLLPLLLPIIQCGYRHICMFQIGAVDRFRFVPQSPQAKPALKPDLPPAAKTGLPGFVRCPRKAGSYLFIPHSRRVVWTQACAAAVDPGNNWARFCLFISCVARFLPNARRPRSARRSPFQNACCMGLLLMTHPARSNPGRDALHRSVAFVHRPDVAGRFHQSAL